MSQPTDKTATQEADRLARKGNPSRDVRKWLHKSHSGTLGTLSMKKGIEGFPVGSIVPFAVDGHGRPLILIARIAAHTRNLKVDNRATLFVHDPEASGDPQASWRASKKHDRQPDVSVAADSKLSASGSVQPRRMMQLPSSSR